MTATLRVIDGGLSDAAPDSETEGLAAARAVLAQLGDGYAHDFATSNTAAGLVYYAGFADVVPGLTLEERERRRSAQVFVLRINENGRAWARARREATR